MELSNKPCPILSHVVVTTVDGRRFLFSAVDSDGDRELVIRLPTADEIKLLGDSTVVELRTTAVEVRQQR